MKRVGRGWRGLIRELALIKLVTCCGVLRTGVFVGGRKWGSRRRIRKAFDVSCINHLDCPGLAKEVVSSGPKNQHRMDLAVTFVENTVTHDLPSCRK